jgi:hypothetical protein
MRAATRLDGFLGLHVAPRRADYLSAAPRPNGNERERSTLEEKEREREREIVLFDHVARKFKEKCHGKGEQLNPEFTILLSLSFYFGCRLPSHGRNCRL